MWKKSLPGTDSGLLFRRAMFFQDFIASIMHWHRTSQVIIFANQHLQMLAVTDVPYRLFLVRLKTILNFKLLK